MLELATAADRDAVNALANQVHAMHVAWRPDVYEMVAERYSPEQYAQLCKQRQLYVAKIDGIVVGYLRIAVREREEPGLKYRKVMRLEEICVEEICRGQRIGTQMVLEARALAKAFGCTDMQLGVYPQNDDAIAFYQNCGFTIRSIEMERKV